MNYKQCSCGHKNYNLKANICEKCGMNILYTPTKIDETVDINNLEKGNNEITDQNSLINKQNNNNNLINQVFNLKKENAYSQNSQMSFDLLKAYIRDNDKDYDAKYKLAVIYLYGMDVEVNKKEAYRLIKNAAEHNHSESQALLGNAFLNGILDKEEIIIEKNEQVGIEWLVKAGKKNKPNAIRDLINYYFNHLSNEADLNNINYWLKKGFNFKDSVGDLGFLAFQDAQYITFKIGDKYYDGLGFEQSFRKAFEYYMEAAKYNNLNAIYKIAHMYDKGQGVYKNFDKALEYYKDAAIKGLTKAQLYLGDMYKQGDDRVNQNLDESVYWYELAAKKGYVYAMYNLANIYKDKSYANRNIEKSDSYFKMIETRGEVNTIKKIAGEAYLNKKYDIARHWFEIAASLNDGDSYNNLHVLYIYGEGVEKDINKALEYLRKGVDLDNKMCLYNLAIYYLKGNYVPQDFEKAFNYLKRFAEKNVLDQVNFANWAYSKLAFMYLCGIGTAINQKESLRWCKEAIKRGERSSYPFMGFIYYKGNEEFRNIKEAYKCFEIAAKDNDSTAQYYLGLMYLNGDGVIASEKTAREWLNKSVAQNYAPAKDLLKQLDSDNLKKSQEVTLRNNVVNVAKDLINLNGVYISIENKNDFIGRKLYNILKFTDKRTVIKASLKSRGEKSIVVDKILKMADNEFDNMSKCEYSIEKSNLSIRLFTLGKKIEILNGEIMNNGFSLKIKSEPPVIYNFYNENNN